MLRNPFNKQKKSNKGRDSEGKPATGTLSADLEALRGQLGEENRDVIYRRFSDRIILVYLTVFADQDIVNRDIIAHLPALQRGEITPDQLPVGEYIKTPDLKNTAQKVLRGYAALLADGSKEVYLYKVKNLEKRSIDEPPTERTTRGSRTGFIEDIETNIAQLRNIINTPTLKVDYFKVGTLSVKKVAIIYLKDVASPDIVGEVRHRIKNIKIDDALATGTLENHFEDHPWSLFPQAYGTEKPTRVVANLMEGRVAVLLDGTPYVLIVPALFAQFMQGTEDYFDRFWVANFARVLRYIALVIAITATPVYISLVTYHHELLPLELLMSIAEQRRDAPFPPIVEALFMELIIELLREAGLRLPNPLGQTMGVVGGIILGQAIVNAKIVGPLIIIFVSVSAVASFTIPNYSASLGIRLAKYPLMLLASLFGALGISIGVLAFITHQASMSSFGVPYMAPLAPTRFRDLGDSVFVSHIWKMKRRPASIPHRKDRRIKDSPQEHHKR